jgi:uncharacterized BrkB/YihY/UPF0761 family membrane protein
VEPADEHEVDQPSEPPSLVARARARATAARGHAKRLAERAQAERQRHATVDAAFEMADHDSEVGGGIMAGALAYRLFIWLLPLGLVAIAGLGFAAEAGSRSPESAAKSMGLAGLVSSSVASAANSSARWYALLIGIPLLVFTTRSLLRALIVIHRLVWTDVRRAVPKPTLGATLRLLPALLGFFVISALASAARAWSSGGGILVTLLIPPAYAALWLLISTRLPHRDAIWRDLVPGAIVFGLGVEVLHVVTAYVIAPQASSKQGTYGALGVAAALLLGLYLTSRHIVASAVVNATLVARRTPPA